MSSKATEECYHLHKLTLLRDDHSALLRIPVSAIAAGKFTCISGPSGAGKSSLLRALAGLNFSYSGNISYCSNDASLSSANDNPMKADASSAHNHQPQQPLHTMNDGELTRFRRLKVGFVFQQHRLINELSVLANTTLAANWVDKRQRLLIEERADMLLNALGIFDTARLCSNCSGGEQQRIAVARALAGLPELVLADEPTASLDSINRHQLMDVMIDSTVKQGRTLIACTHDEAMIDRADHVWHLHHGVLEPVR